MAEEENVIPVIGLLFDALERSSTALLAGCSFVFIHTASDDFVLLGCFLRGGSRGNSTAGGSFRTCAGIDFGFQHSRFLLDNAETAFDGVVGDSCNFISTSRAWRRQGVVERKGCWVVSTLHTSAVHCCDFAVVEL